jgi:hypothetical protein
MRLATYNIEWFVNLFDAHGRLLEDDGWSARFQVTRGQQLRALGAVFRAMDSDAVMVIEAPDNNRHRKTVPMLEAFAARFGLRTGKAAMGFENDTQQEIAILYDPGALTIRHDPKGEPMGALPVPRRDEVPDIAPRFDGAHHIDLDATGAFGGRTDILRFNKPPFEIAATSREGRDFRMIGVHMKSKAPHGPKGEEAARRLAIAARREQLAQCIWLRQRVLEHLAAHDPLIVMGDFNDGPGLDSYEKLFGRSGVEVVLGWDEPRETRLYDPHARAALGRKLAALPASARFYLPGSDPGKGRFFSALLDYIMVSPDLRAMNPAWRIWHPFDDPTCYADPALRDALLTASDHFPVTIDLTL